MRWNLQVSLFLLLCAAGLQLQCGPGGLWQIDTTASCAPASHAVLQTAPRWSSTFGSSNGRARGCLLSRWAGGAAARLVEISPGGEVFGYDGNAFQRDVRLTLPADARTKARRFWLLVFGSNVPDRLTDQQAYCQGQMTASDYDCLNDQGGCWFGWQLAPQPQSPDLQAPPLAGTDASCKLLVREETAPSEPSEPTEPTEPAGDGAAPGDGPSEPTPERPSEPPKDQPQPPEVPSDIPEGSPDQVAACAGGALPCVTTWIGPPAPPVSGTGSTAHTWFQRPAYVAVHSGGSLYTFDNNSGHIYELTKAKRITHVAGKGKGLSDAPAMQARLYMTGQMAFLNDVLYFPQYNCIRGFDLTANAVITVAGHCEQSGMRDGAAATARFTNPTAVAPGPLGVLLIADRDNHCVRTYDPVRKQVATLAGTCGQAGTNNGNIADATFDAPARLLATKDAVYTAGSTGHFCVRKIDLTNSTISTLAGKCDAQGIINGQGASARFHSIDSLTLGPNGGNIYIVESGLHCVRKLALATNTVSNFAGRCGTANQGHANGIASNASFRFPTSIAYWFDALAIADSGNQLLRRVDTQGDTSQLAGIRQRGNRSGKPQNALLNFPRVALYDGTSKIYISSEGGHCIRRYDQRFGVVSAYAGSCNTSGNATGSLSQSRFSSLSGMALLGDTLYIADNGNNCLRAIDTSTGMVTNAAGQCQPSISFVETRDGIGPAVTFNRLGDLTTDGTSRVFLAETTNHCLRVFDATTKQVTTLAGACHPNNSGNRDGGDALLNTPRGPAFDGVNTLYFADSGNACIRKYDFTTRRVSAVAGICGQAGHKDGPAAQAQLYRPSGLLHDRADKILYITDEFANCIRKLDLTTQLLSTYVGVCDPNIVKHIDGPAQTARLISPQTLTIGPGGDLLMPERFNHRIRLIQLK